MRNFKKILMVICVFAILTVGCVLLAYAADGSNAGTVAELNTLIEAAEAAVDADSKYTAVVAAAEYFNTKTIEPTEEGYEDAALKVKQLTLDLIDELLTSIEVDNIAAVSAYKAITGATELIKFTDEESLTDIKDRYDNDLVKAVMVLVDDVDADIETTLKTAQNQVAVNRVKRVLADCTLFGETDLLADIKAEFDELSAAHERALEANYAALDSENLISDYELPIYFEETWEGCKLGMTGNDFGGRWTVDYKGTKNQAGIEVDEYGNKYYVHRYLEKDNPAASYVQIPLTQYKVKGYQPFVIEFDIATFGELPGAGVQIEPGGYNLPSGERIFPPNYFDVKPGGNISTYDGTVLLPDAFVKGQWLHIMIVFEPEEFVYKLYVAGEYLGKTNAKYNGTITYDHSQLCFRLSGQATTYGEIAYDNISIYSGSGYRQHDKLANMTDDEKFVYYVDYLADETKPLSSKKLAYDLATEALPAYWVYTDEENGIGDYTDAAKADQALMDAVDGYLGFDIDILIQEVKRLNLQEYIDLVSALRSTERNMDNADDRVKSADEIAAFANVNNGLIDYSADNDGSGESDYVEYYRIYQKLAAEANYDTNAETFIRYINRFTVASTLSAKERYYSRADELVLSKGIDVELITNENAPARENFKELIDAYAIYLEGDAIIYELVKENNSKKIVNCIGRISEFDTEEEWLENRAEMEKYIDIVSVIVFDRDENGEAPYDLGYKGITDAVDFFNKAYEFFFALHQNEHVSYIQGKLDLANSTELYIEKIGYVSQIERYIATTDIDLRDERIITLLNNIETCKAELLLREEDYSKILTQNAVYFVNIVERMRTAETYDEQRKYFEEAALLYFYIDASVEGAARAVEIYDEYSVKLDRIAESSVAFIEAVAVYNACQTEDEKYAALVECYYNAQFVELSYEGAKEAMAEYQAAYDAYMNYAEAVNADVQISGNAVGSLRANCGMLTVVAVIIKKIFGI